MALGSKLDEIEQAMIVAINGILETNGFNFDWGTSNEDDLALKDKYPNAEIFFPEETNNDDEEGSDAGAYENDVTAEIKVYGKMTAVNQNPNFSINKEHNLALADLKKLFGINFHITDTANSILYRSMRRELQKNGDIFIPGPMITVWKISYAQVRIDPSTNAN